VKREPPIQILITKTDGTIRIDSDGQEIKAPKIIKDKFDGN
jgi:hypothetical protein